MIDVYFTIDENVDGVVQLAISDENSGYRICGPKYAGSSRTIKRHKLSARDAAEIRTYLRRVVSHPTENIEPGAS